MDKELESELEPEKAPKKGRKKLGIALGVVAAVFAVAGAGMWVWHEQPSFCNAFCHDPMDPYLATYEAEPVEGVTDRLGNTVDGSTMLAAVHRAEGETSCLDCHVPTVSQQVSEVGAWVSGSYESPLEERSLSELTAPSGKSYETFCLNEACHELLSVDGLGKMTSNMSRNVHDTSDAPHASRVFECSECHKAHTQSVVICSQCHDDADVPEGWLTYDEYKALESVK